MGNWSKKKKPSCFVLYCLPICQLKSQYVNMSTFKLKSFSQILHVKAEVESRTQGSRPRTQKKTEAKAKDSLSEDRPSRGQGQKCSMPRTKDTAAGFSKKKGLQKSFSGNLQFIGVARIFDWGGLNHKSRAMTSSKICLLALNQDFAKGEGLN